MELEGIVVASNTEILFFPLLKCAHTYFGEVVQKFIMATVDYLCDPSDLVAKKVVYGKWVLMLEKNCIDCKVSGCGENYIGVVVGHNYTFPKKPFLDCSNIKLLSETFYLSVINRSKTTHDCKLFM